ncbi:MAG: hypothetical protein JXQ90_04015 [Cyclobacteriaceae bacterium]
MEQKDKKRRQLSIAITVIVNGLLALLLFFIVAWREPFPPIPEYGIDLAFGMVEEGRSPAPVATTESETEEVQENESNDVDQSEAEQEPVESKQVEETIEQVEQSQETTQDIDSPDVVEETENEIVKEELEPEVQKEDSEAEEPQTTESSTASTVTENITENVDQGTTENAGDEGEPDGVIDERALYSNATSGDVPGSSLEMTGWRLMSPPKVNDTSNEAGKITFEITVDSDGYVVGIRQVESTISPSLSLKYRNAVEELLLEKTSDYKPAPTSSGKITFILKAK